MRRKSIVLLILLMMLIVTACGGAGEDADIYMGTEVAMMGIAMSPEDVSEGGIILALDDNGKATLTLGGEDYNAEWEVKEGEFVLTQGSDSFTGTMEGDVVKIINLLDMGLDITFVKEGASGESAATSDESAIISDESSTTSDENAATSEADNENQNQPIGKYMLSSMKMLGMEMSYVDIQSAELEMTLEFTEDSANLTAYGTTVDVPWDASAKTIDLEGVVTNYTMEGDDISAIGESDGTEMEFVFTAESSPTWEEIKAAGSAMEEQVTQQ